jgi:hypothetical protein
MSGFGKGVLGFLVAGPLIAVAIAAVVVGSCGCTPSGGRGRSLTGGGAWGSPMQSRCSSAASSTRRRSSSIGREIFTSGAACAEVERVARSIEIVAGCDEPAFVSKATLLPKNEANA